MTSHGIKHRSMPWLIAVGLLLLINSGQVAAAGISWDQLSNSEQRVLKPHKSKWSKYSVSTRRTMKRWAGLSSGERSRIKRRHGEWNRLSATSKSKIINKLNRYKRMSPGEPRKLKAWRKWVKSLPGHEQRKLHKKLPGMSAKARREYIRQLENKYGKRK